MNARMWTECWGAWRPGGVFSHRRNQTPGRRRPRRRAVAIGALVLLAGFGWTGEQDVVINEVMYHPSEDEDNREFLELYNRGTDAVDLSSWSISGGIVFTFPAGLSIDPGAYLVIARSSETVTSLYGISNVTGNFEQRLGNGGDSLVLQNASYVQTDQLAYDDDPPWPEGPDGGGPSLECIDPWADNADAANWAAGTATLPGGTPGRQNSVYLMPDVSGTTQVVINEIHYNPSPAEGGYVREFVELYNRAAEAVDLSGWSFCDGLEFTFPSGASIAAGGFALVCRDPSRFGGVPGVYGPFAGQLSNSGERVTLVSSGVSPRQVDSVQYDDGWSWPKDADGTGLSLERRDPSLNDTGPGNWEASRSSGTACLRIVATGPGTGGQHSAYVTLPPPGPPPPPPYTVTFWARPISGNPQLRIRFSGIAPDGRGVVGTPELSPIWRYYERVGEPTSDRLYFYLVAAGECLIDDVHVLVNGSDILLNGSFEVDTAGWTAIGNHSGSGRTVADHMDSGGGTPGAANSRYTASPTLPVISDPIQIPTDVTSSNSVAVAVNASASAGLNAATLHYETAWGAGYNAVAMLDDGLHGDGTAGDGRFGVVVPAQADRTLVRWHVVAEDAIGQVASYPRDAPVTAESYFVLDVEAATLLPVYRVVASPGNWYDLTQRDVYCDDEVDAFFCYGSDARQVGLRYRGGEHSRRDPTKKPYRVRFDSDRPFAAFPAMGEVVRMNLNADHLDKSCLRTAFAYDFMRDGGLRCSHAQHVHLRMDHPPTGEEFMGIYTQVEAIDDQFLERADNFGDSSGNLYKSLWTTFQYEGTDPDDYRDQMEKATNEEEDDWSDLIAFVETFANTPDEQFKTTLDSVFEIDSYFDYFAYGVAMGAWDNYIIFPHNFFLYHQPTNGKFYWVPWDYDEVLQAQTTYLGEDLAAYHPFIPPNREVATYLEFTERVMADAEYRAAYEQRIINLLYTEFVESNVHARIDALYQLIRNDVYADTHKSFSDAEFDAEVAAMKTTMTERRNYLLSLIPAGMTTCRRWEAYR